MSLQNIPTLNHSDQNVGSLRDILFIPVDKVDLILPPVSGALPAGCLQFESAAAALFKLLFTEDTAEYNYEEVKSGNGTTVKVKIAAVVAKDYQFRPSQWMEMEDDKFFVITRDNNNRSRLHGYINKDGEKYGMSLSVDFGTGKQRANFNGYKVEFSLESPYRPGVVGDISTISLVTGLPIDLDISAGVIDPNPPDEA
jgi:hypothetical protein